MEMSTEIDQLATALAEAQAELEPAKKNASNPMLRNKYADLASCIEAVKNVLPKHGLAFTQLINQESEADMVNVTTLLLHKSGQWLRSDCRLRYQANKGVNAAQAAGSAITYAKRYGLCGIIGLSADVDDDGCGAGQCGNQQQQYSRQAQRQPAPQQSPIQRLMGALNKAGIQREQILPKLSEILGREIKGSKELTPEDINTAIAALGE